MILLDTCALLWSANQEPLSPAAVQALSQATAASALYLSPVSAWEIGVLASRGRISLHLPADQYVAKVFSQPGVRVAGLTPEIAVKSSSLPGNLHPDPADRLLISTARVMGLTLVTRDRRILAYGGRGHVAVLAC